MPNEMSLIKSASGGLAHFMHSGLQQKLEPIRLARAGYALLVSGCSVKGTFPGTNLASYLVETQRPDRGWADVEETVWCLGYLKTFGERYQQVVTNGQKWLTSIQLPCGGWGKSERDQPRIPITALVISLVPEMANNSTLEWLANQWKSDLDSPTQLTYKGAFFLLSQAHSQVSTNNDLMNRTVSYLINGQEEDGGFGPWKGHPVGSDPWSTGVALWGLSTVGKQAPRRVIKQAVSWLESKQLSNGLWPYHYMDDGTAMALIGISSISPLLSEQ